MTEADARAAGERHAKTMPYGADSAGWGSLWATSSSAPGCRVLRCWVGCTACVHLARSNERQDGCRDEGLYTIAYIRLQGPTAALELFRPK